MQKSEIADIIDDLVIILDTNVLLYLYKCSFNTSVSIISLFEKMKEQMLIPHRVYEEYLDNKDPEQGRMDRKYGNFTKGLSNQVDALKIKLSNDISEGRKYHFPNCDVLESGINALLDNVKQNIDIYKQSLSTEIQNKSAQIANVEQLIQFFENTNKIIDEPNMIQMLDYIKEGEFRYKYKMPPGYMDEEEKDKEAQKEEKNNFKGKIRKYGDLFIWKEIIQTGQTLNENQKILFVTNDTKEDWWELKNNKQTISMRNELYKEYVAITGNEKIEFVTLSNFYELFSDYYEICDIKTTLELDYQSYIQDKIYNKYSKFIDEEIIRYVKNIDWLDIDSEFYDVDQVHIDYDDISIDEITLHFDDDGEAAFYDVRISTETYPIILEKSDNFGKSWIGQVILKINISARIDRDLRNLDEDAISCKTFSYEVISKQDIWDIVFEAEDDVKAEVAETKEDYYNH